MAPELYGRIELLIFEPNAPLATPECERFARLPLPCPTLSAIEHCYPWKLADLFPGSSGQLPLLGYGSLMNMNSARRTFSAECVNSARPVIVLGARRVYEYVMSPRGRGVYGTHDDEGRYGVLNAQATRDPDDWFNAIQFNLDASDVPALISRESAYDLLPAWTIGWGETDSEPRIGYFLSCRQPSYGGRQVIDTEILPHPRYHEVCEEGCRAVSDEFLTAFRRTTWVRQQRIAESTHHLVPAARTLTG